MKSSKLIPIAFAVMSIMTSCVFIETIDETEYSFDKREEKEGIYTKTDATNLEIMIKNKTDLYLFINELELHNTSTVKDTVIKQLFEPTMMLSPDETALAIITRIPQERSNEWNAIRLPEESTGCYLKVLCRIMAFYEKDENYNEEKASPIWCGATKDQPDYAYIPFRIADDDKTTSEYTISLGEDIVWYSIRKGYPEPILKIISFNPDVESWTSTIENI